MKNRQHSSLLKNALLTITFASTSLAWAIPFQDQGNNAPEILTLAPLFAEQEILVPFWMDQPLRQPASIAAPVQEDHDAHVRAYYANLADLREKELERKRKAKYDQYFQEQTNQAVAETKLPDTLKEDIGNQENPSAAVQRHLQPFPGAKGDPIESLPPTGAPVAQESENHDARVRAYEENQRALATETNPRLREALSNGNKPSNYNVPTVNRSVQSEAVKEDHDAHVRAYYANSADLREKALERARKAQYDQYFQEQTDQAVAETKLPEALKEDIGNQANPTAAVQRHLQPFPGAKGDPIESLPPRGAPVAQESEDHDAHVRAYEENQRALATETNPRLREALSNGNKPSNYNIPTGNQSVHRRAVKEGDNTPVRTKLEEERRVEIEHNPPTIPRKEESHGTQIIIEKTSPTNLSPLTELEQSFLRQGKELAALSQKIDEIIKEKKGKMKEGAEELKKRLEKTQATITKFEQRRKELATKTPEPKEEIDSMKISIGLVDNNIADMKKDLERLVAEAKPTANNKKESGEEFKRISKKVERLTSLICNNAEKERKRRSSLISEDTLALFQQMAAINQMFHGSNSMAQPQNTGTSSMNDMMTMWMFATMMNKVNTPTTGYIGRNYLEIFGATNYQDYRNASEREMVGFGNLQNGPYRLAGNLINNRQMPADPSTQFGGGANGNIYNYYYGNVNGGSGTQTNHQYEPWNYNGTYSARQDPNFRFQFSAPALPTRN